MRGPGNTLVLSDLVGCATLIANFNGLRSVQHPWAAASPTLPIIADFARWAPGARRPGRTAGFNYTLQEALTIMVGALSGSYFIYIFTNFSGFITLY